MSRNTLTVTLFYGQNRKKHQKNRLFSDCWSPGTEGGEARGRARTCWGKQGLVTALA